ncbi:non-ribosomal peptide synthetase [Pseudoalteromonas aurantia]|uniref:non-ribosomal peptide synthetase n=1 Tax=Pseudoalteromonas aurantia TaxID=43654 RepID=UPI001BB157AB|nr:non-ribosomal peptide synthetase [Pseudoalteromonas aurantia]
MSEGIEIPSLGEERDSYPLSFAQEQMLLLERLPESQGSYQVPVFTKLNTNVDQERLSHAIDAVIARHAVLRSTFDMDEEGEGYQKFLPTGNKVQTLNISAEHLKAFVDQKVTLPFELHQSPAMRSFIINTEQDCYLLIVWHHIVFDGWSSGLFFSEVEKYYRASDEIFSPLQIQYAEYALWQREYMQGEILTSHQRYWESQVQNAEPLNVLTDFVRPALPSFIGADATLSVSGGLAEQLAALAAQNSTTLHTVLMTAYFMTLSKLSGQTDIVIGTPMENRAQVQTQSLIGYFVNSVPMRCQLKSDLSIAELIGQVHQLNLDAKRYQMLPFEQIVGLANVVRDASRHPLFQAFFTLNQFSDVVDVENSSACFAPELDEQVLEYTPAKFDLTLDVTMGKEQIDIVLNYATDLFSEHTATNMLNIYHQVLLCMCTAQVEGSSALKLLSDNEVRRQVERFAQQNFGFETQTLVEQFKVIAATQPNVIAVETFEDALTYQQLDTRSDALACYLCQHFGVSGRLPEGTLIPVYFKSGINVIVAKMAILKAGAAYVPISSKLPQSRVQFILEDTAAKVVLTQSVLESELLTNDVTVINVDSEVCYQHRFDLSTGNKNDLAYVIYTSGTTGQPKGVMIEHAAMSNLVHNNKRRYALGDKEKFAILMESYAFDITAGLLFTALLNGGGLVVIEDNNSIERAIDHFPITHLDATASILQMLDERTLEKPLRIISGGEVTPLSFAKRWSHKLINAFGPTESTVECHQYRCENLPDGINGVPIGDTVINLRCYVLDEHLNMLPPGCPGILYISGIGLARGYLNQPELTNARFINNPFATLDDTDDHQRMYCTGDKVVKSAAGELMFLGRGDDQVQLNGTRIELGEIASQLTALEGIQQAVVVAHGTQDVQLVAYVIAKPNTNLDQSVTLDALGQSLPANMIPRHLYILESFPLTANGKLDKKALPIPSVKENITEYIPASSELEHELVDIWATVLALDITEISIVEDFFSLGGSSLKAIKMVRLIESLIGVKLAADFVLRHSCIRDMASEIPKSGSSTNVVVKLNTVAQSNATLVLFHPVGGGVYCYRELLSNLAIKNSVLGVQHPEFAGEEGWLDASLESLSDHYADLLTRCLETKLVQMLGWSMGGVIAYAVAQKLIIKGYQVEWVGLIDSYVTSDFTSPSDDKAVATQVLNDALLEEHVLHANNRALDGYAPSGTVPQVFGVFVEQNKSHPVLSNAIKRWNERSEQEFIYSYVEGDHFSIMEYPHLHLLTQSLTQLITNIESKKINYLTRKEKTMNTNKVFLRSNIKVEPLWNSWYAWPYMLQPATAGCLTSKLHLRILESFLQAPHLHKAAAKNPAMRGGPFMDFSGSIELVSKHVDKTKTDLGDLIGICESIKQVNEMLEKDANGFSIEEMYEKVPENLKGFIEIGYDLNHNASIRFIEPLLYNSTLYRPELQSISLSFIHADDRPFVLSTPRFPLEGELHLPLAYSDPLVDRLFKMRDEAASTDILNEIIERFNLSAQEIELLKSFFVEQKELKTTPLPDSGVRVDYYGHATILIQTDEISIMTDPVIAYDFEGASPRYTYENLPEKLDYVVLTHNHQDHVMFETLLQIRHKIGTVLVPKNNGGSLQDPSMKLLLNAVGFNNVVELDELEDFAVPGGRILGLPFFGEHGDLHIKSKLAFYFELQGKKLLCAADSNNIEPKMYEHVQKMVGDIDHIFIGMECKGAPMSWLYGPLYSKPVERKMDQSRRLNGSDYERALGIVDQFNPSNVYVYAMGMEPWLTYISSIEYEAESLPIIESNKLMATCKQRGIEVRRLNGVERIDIYEKQQWSQAS